MFRKSLAICITTSMVISNISAVEIKESPNESFFEAEALNIENKLEKSSEKRNHTENSKIKSINPSTHSEVINSFPKTIYHRIAQLPWKKLPIIFLMVLVPAFVGGGLRIFEAIQSRELSRENLRHIAERRFNEDEPELRRQWRRELNEEYAHIYRFLNMEPPDPDDT